MAELAPSQARLSPGAWVGITTARVRWAALVVSLALTAVLGTVSAWAAPAVGAQAGVTTTTLPVDNRTFGDIIPEPNSGRAPEAAGDPGGWLQVSLFFLICAAIVAIVGVVWWKSRRARARLAAAGQDRESLARASGKGLRQKR